ncbi:MAG: carbamoyltransferase HypF [Actinomycetota bacterium]
MRARRSIRVEGIVQGVGFRPFVYNLARRLELAGFVLNDSEGVILEIEGEPAVLDQFASELSKSPPPLARIEVFNSVEMAPVGEEGFRIVDSKPGLERTTLISPDVATCAACRLEIGDPAARRYRYPFTNCTNCGPRFTITLDVPYDRPNTTMAGFAMCKDCSAEYHDPGDRRFHAQPIACPRCGPTVSLTDAGGERVHGAPIYEAAGLLASGHIVAVKGMGGYHLACDAHDEEAVSALRSRKHREDKPFALMAPDAEAIRRYCEVTGDEDALLHQPNAPIVLLRQLPDSPAAPSVAPGNRFLGFMLAYTPLHHILLSDFAGVTHGERKVLVMTSGNVSDEPIAFQDDHAYRDLKGIADFFLIHSRPIHIRCDDSVVRVPESAPAEQLLRRARGYAPAPVKLAKPVPRPILAVGAELKHTFAVAKGGRAFVSHHIGDLENWETMRSFLQGVEHFTRVFDVHPEVVAYDLHPEYLSTKWAKDQLSGEAEELPGVALRDAAPVGVQHHHAHIASCLADNLSDGPVIGLALDGTGWGEDATLWGCEVLVADTASYERAGHLRKMPLAGGAAAIKEPWRMAAVYLAEAFGEEAGGLKLEFAARNRERWGPVLDMARKGVNSIATSSAGRLFDAVAAVAGLRDLVNYEGQAAIELEQAADASERGAYSAGPLSSQEGPIVIDGVALFREAVEDLAGGAPLPLVSARFHNGLADALVGACLAVSERTGLREAALSGGTFQNLLLAGRVAAALQAAGFKVFQHRRVPANDGGISLGQVAVAAARTAKK